MSNGIGDDIQAIKADIKLTLVRYWFYIAFWLGVLLVILLAPWWVTLTLLLTITISVLVSRRYLGRWSP